MTNEYPLASIQRSTKFSDQLFALRDEERVRADQQQSQSLLCKSSKSGVELTGIACSKDPQVEAKQLRSTLG